MCYYVYQSSVDGQLGIARDSTGKVYVADGGSSQLKGRFLRMFGRRGCGSGELDRPSGVAVDANGMVYVCDSRNCTL